MATDLIQALERRGIAAMNTSPIDPGYVAISMTTYSVQEFLAAIATGPVSGDDRLAMRILGRGQDLTAEDDPWRFEAIPTIRDIDSNVELRITVSMPESDVAEVLARLG